MKWKTKVSLPLAVGISFALGTTTMAFSEGDSLITKSFLENTYLSRMGEAIEFAANIVADNFLEGKQEELNVLRQEYTTQGMTHARTLLPLSLPQGTEVALPQGSVFVPLTQGLTLDKLGALVDLTKGTEVESLEQGHQYLVAENSSVVLRGGMATGQVAVQGLYEMGEYEIELISSFEDVAVTDWFYSGVEYVKEHNLFNGTTDSLFSPEMSMSRGMVTTVLYRMAGSPEEEYHSATGYFTDVQEGDWFEHYVYWAVMRNLATGMGDGRFAPDESVTREQIMVMLYAFAKDTLGLNMTHSASLTGYTDGAFVASWASEQMAWAVSHDLLAGIPDSNQYLQGEKVASRSEVATILMNFYLNM